MQFPLGDEQAHMRASVRVCEEVDREWQREAGEWKEYTGKCILLSTCICCAIFLGSLADGARSGQGALGLMLEDGGRKLLQGAAQQVGCLLGPLVTCKLFPASWDMCIKTSISPSASEFQATFVTITSFRGSGLCFCPSMLCKSIHAPLNF